MKKYLAPIAAAAIIYAAGCIKPATTNNPGTNGTGALNATGFTISTPSKYAPGKSMQVELTAPKLADGTYIFTYSIYGDSYSGNTTTANVTFANGKGTFTTPALPSSGCLTITASSLQSLSNSSMASIYAKSEFCDSTGVMDATYNNTQFHSTHITAMLSGPALFVSGIVYEPGSSTLSGGKTIQLTVYNYAQTPTSANLIYDNPYAQGRASYSSPSSNQSAVHGKITITTSSPVLSGSFSFTTEDSSKFNGTFTTVAP